MGAMMTHFCDCPRLLTDRPLLFLHKRLAESLTRGPSLTSSLRRRTPLQIKHHLWKRKASTFPDTDPDDLQIWRVNISCDSSNAIFAALQREYRPDIKLLGGEELHPTQKLLEVFFNVPQEGRHIHVIVVAPVLWYRWENQKEPGTLSTKLLTKCVNLGGLAVELSHSNPYAQNLYPFEISFVESDDLRRTKILRRGIPLRELKTFDESPLIIRFPFSGRSGESSYFSLSDSAIHVNLKFLNVPVEIILGHDTGTWHMLLDGTKKKYPKLEEAENEIYYVDAKKNIIENDFTFNNYLKNAPLNDQDEICLTFFVRIKGKRAYIEWDAKDVIREILHQQYANITFLPEFDIGRLGERSRDHRRR
ncbi:hypothetical protein BC936DRAFT_142451 [Jimgerdemannia flammicorona]|uniref:Crinkler effector protein N-terminal domain-containing protein n=1 Tax=Jimgerdemannia flammicorona TaxID=994334 RepID=A0A433DF72_9FUNG|nr:hypothetical protein BC936DRAFT_142451 [Jimgerdemannia flammicorona]